jgi:DNA-binding NtrC family response regulator
MTGKILVVDDEKNMLALFKKILTPEVLSDPSVPSESRDSTPITVHTAPGGQVAWEMVKMESYDLIISDLAMDGMNGMEFLQKVKALKPETPFIMLTGVGTVDDGIKAIKTGAFDYLTKPFQRDELLLTIRKALSFSRLNSEVRLLRERLSEKDQHEFGAIVGKSRSMVRIFEMIRMIAKSDSTVLIEGESGTGKELIAKALHQESLRHERPFVAINCGALPENLLESELFGHVRGAFTGATADKKGLFKEADKGTLFLDEIGDVSLSIQAKLLRALQEKEVRPVGGNHGVTADVRIIAATNRTLLKMIQDKLFREDLYYRLAVITLSLPPLRERKEDIPLLVQRFLEKYCSMNRKSLKVLTPEAMAVLLEHDWPGNIRELENIIERLVVITPDEAIDVSQLPRDLVRKLDQRRETMLSSSVRIFADLNQALSPKSEFKYSDEQIRVVQQLLRNQESLKSITDMVHRELEKIAIMTVLHDVGGNRAEAARRLGISRPALYNKLKEYRIE